MSTPSRRTVLIGAASLMATSWSTSRASAQEAYFDPEQIYGPVTSEPFPVPAINLKRLRPQFLRTVVEFETAETAGTIVIDPVQHFLFVVNGDGRAIRYGVGVGREGFVWSGVAEIKAKREWPNWYPPKEMLARDPHTRQAVSQLEGGLGMAGGVGNPLGARAMYLYQNGRDTLYRIHGTIEPYSIGSSVSSGCIRMINQDVIDLYSRIPLGTKVIVLGDAHPDPRMAHAPRQPDVYDGATAQATTAQYAPQPGYGYGYDAEDQ